MWSCGYSYESPWPKLSGNHVCFEKLSILADYRLIIIDFGYSDKLLETFVCISSFITYRMMMSVGLFDRESLPLKCFFQNFEKSIIDRLSVISDISEKNFCSECGRVGTHMKAPGLNYQEITFVLKNYQYWLIIDWSVLILDTLANYRKRLSVTPHSLRIASLWLWACSIDNRSP